MFVDESDPVLLAMLLWVRETMKSQFEALREEGNGRLCLVVEAKRKERKIGRRL